MDRHIQSNHPKRRLFKTFESIDLMPYSIALLLLLGELYILYQFLHLYGSLNP